MMSSHEAPKNNAKHSITHEVYHNASIPARFYIPKPILENPGQELRRARCHVVTEIPLVGRVKENSPSSKSFEITHRMK
jgi:hypothetical protein